MRVLITTFPLAISLRHISLILLFGLLFACNSKKREYVSKPARSVGNPEIELLDVNAVSYHLNDTATRIYLQIDNENLLYKRPDTSKSFYADMRIYYRLLTEVNSDKILDSNSFYLLDRAGTEQVLKHSLYAGFLIKAKRQHDYYLEIDVMDVNRKTRYKKGINIYKSNRLGRQNFLVTSNDSVAFKNNFLKNDEVVIHFTEPEINKLQVDCYFTEFGPALPPFSTKAPDELKYKPDSIFEIIPEGKHLSLRMPSKGFYHVRADTKNFEGVTLYTVDETFPGVSNSLEMINCTRYIMFKEEFETCKNAVDKKAAIDDFWLNIGGSLERARELLKKYYGRVKEANKHYSSYTQGWKSDRGMIYIVMGAPANIYKSKKDEIWMYGNEANPNALRFVFNKTPNPYSDNDYILERSPFYKESYHTAVEYWRQGLVYQDGRR